MNNIYFLPCNIKSYFLEDSTLMLRLLLCSPGNADSEHFKRSMASVWVKMATVWLCFVIYLWTLLAPLILGNCRDFEYNSEWRERREKKKLHIICMQPFPTAAMNHVLCLFYAVARPYIPVYCTAYFLVNSVFLRKILHRYICRHVVWTPGLQLLEYAFMHTAITGRWEGLGTRLMHTGR